MAMIASDMNNPDFAGAVSPDSRLAVQFYTKPVKNDFESMKQGRPIFEDRDFVKIFVPGDSTSVIDTYAREDHKARFPLQWAHFQNKHGGDAREIGTPLSQWSLITPSQAEEMRALKFFTVESIANATDLNLQKLGMAAGMSPFTFRDRARSFLRVASNEAASHEAEERVKALEADNQKLKDDMAAQMAEMQAQIKALLPKKRGPKAKAKTEEAPQA